ncbi:hypothetical protein J2T57_002791 [Natronocella acetinitrilica]|uniref:PNPLA domain-containing protein n=1 Tax=Natronocella acetinitrilica TaxID=414046 RepID=A0AAE3G6H4_9GAMM|nr:CBASS cGAMP-activated phospholipase [Natronocella acetinitrilica]MCP1675641.1 hypothetical protein [Natronocella acetinitrilica]
MTTENAQQVFRVLSIDGGGMRGLYTATYLDALARRYRVTRGEAALDIGNGFDLIAGTSTGAIIASALAAGIPLARVAGVYRDHGAAIFPRKVPNGLGTELLRQIFRRPAYLRQGAEALTNALEQELGQTTVGEVWNDRRIGLCIPAVDMSRNRAWVFKTPHLPDTLHRDDGYRLADVCLAATAAPVYRSMARLATPDNDGHHVFVDGGLWANNPVLIGLIDALSMTGPGDRIEIYCLGTCPRPEGESVGAGDLDRGFREWKFGAGVVSLAVSAQEHAFDNMARMIAGHIDRDCQIVRFPTGKVPASVMKYLDLDETSKEGLEALVNQAHTDVSETMSKCRDPGDPAGQLFNSLLMDLPTVSEGVR